MLADFIFTLSSSKFIKSFSLFAIYLMLSPFVSFAQLTGANMNNPIDMSTYGTGSFTYTDTRSNSGYGNDYGQPSEDIFYKFTVQGTTQIIISHCGSGLADTYMWLLNSSGIDIAHDDDNGPQCSSYQASISTTVPAGTYYIVSEGWSTGTGNITTSVSLVVQTPPAPVVFDTRNFIRTWEATAPETDPNNLITRPVTDVKQGTQYFDGLGRTEQAVMKQISPLQKDMVSPVIYDEFGRETLKYLAYVSTSTDGLFKIDPLPQQVAFYSDANGVLKGQGETYFYSQTDYEPSPLNRMIKNFAPGNSWVGSRGSSSEKSVQQQYQINSSGDNVQIWNIAVGQGSIPTTGGAYEAGELYKSVSIDEAGHKVVEYKDKEGKVILKKVQVGIAPAEDHLGWLCTYYVYDDLNNLRFVIPPKVVELVNGSWSISQTIADELCFRYEYDARNRMIIKKVPGAGEAWMVYDSRDRLIMAQDGNKRLNKWMVTVYDELNRPVKTGLLSDGNDLNYHAVNVYNSTAYPYTGGSNFELLSQTYYDNYDWVAGAGSGLGATFDVSSIYSGNHFITPYNTSPLYTQPLTADYAVKGMVTGSMVKVLGTTSQYLYSVNFYDEKGRVIQSQSINTSGGKDIFTTQYDFSGKVLRTVIQHQKNGDNSQTHLVLTKMSYDHAGRLLSITKTLNSSINGQSVSMPEKVIVQNQYDELGQLKTKSLGINPINTSLPLETLTYDYNLRGWMLGANRDYAKTSSNTTNYFGFDLGYDKTISTYTNPQYNGNITGTEWKSRGDNEVRRYDFTYDAVNRLSEANFVQPSSSLVDFSVSNLDYDANGNILHMNQMGLKLNSSSPIDQLVYNYFLNSNKLKSVNDGIVGDNKLGDFTDKNTGDDYGYDVNGNLITDKNKRLNGSVGIDLSSSAGAITYNHLNLPQQINVKDDAGNSKGTITYTYDAAGNKLKKVTVDNSTTGKTITTTTSYISGFIYESKTTSPTDAKNPDYSDVLQFTGHEEGRIRYKPLTNAFAYDYFLKDHLGNVRMVLTDDVQQDIYPAATLETSKVVTEQTYYDINTGQIADKPSSLSDYTNGSNGIADPPINTTFDNTNSAKVYKLNSNNQKTGLGIVLKVMSGDKVDVFGKSYYMQANTGGGGANTNLVALDIINSLISSATGVAAGKGSATDILSNTSGTASPLAYWLNNNHTPPTGTTPKAFINYILLDEQFKYVTAGASPVDPNAYTLKNHFSELQNIAVTKNGYLYVYCSNESPVDVFFDNLQVVHTKGPILEETHYYPFGLVMAGISSKAAGGIENKKKFNSGTELNSDFDINLYETNFRSLDPQLGRFWQVDPLADMSFNNSHYAFGSNNPISINDPLGLKDSIPWKKLAEVAVQGVRKAGSSFVNWFTGANVGYSGSGWGHGPRRMMASLFGIGNSASNLFELGLHSQLQSTQVNLTGGLLNGLKTDPAMIAFQNKIIAALKADPRFRKLTFVLANKQVIEFGGKRWGSQNENWGSLGDNNPALHAETWEVAGNALTWAVRHATVEYSATVKADGTAVISYHLNDQLDLTPGNRSGAYNNITSVAGFLYHDVAGGNSGMKVNADWQTTVK